MKKEWIKVMMVACGLMVFANVISAGEVEIAKKTEIEKKAQLKKITLKLKNVPLEEACNMISLLGRIPIKVTNPVEKMQNITLDINDVSVNEAIELLRRHADINYVIVDEEDEVFSE